MNFCGDYGLRSREKRLVPPYIIFSDKTLIDMCVKLPEDRGTMLDVSGVGQAKYEKYGQRFLTAIREYGRNKETWRSVRRQKRLQDYQKQKPQKGTFDRTEYNRAHNRPEGAAAPGMLRKTRNLSGNLVSG